MSGIPDSLAARIHVALRARGADVAVVATDVALSGEVLDSRAVGVADKLRAGGVARGAIIGLPVDRSIDAIVSILGILYAGCAYLPLDPLLPDAWRQHLLSLTGVGAVLVEGEPVIEDLAAGTLGAAPAELAYVIGTSGTTGLPKGVAIRADSLLRYSDAFTERVGGADALRGLRMASTTTLAADLGNTMLFPALLSGGEFHLLSHRVTRDPTLFAAYMASHAIDVVKMVPSHLRAMLGAGRAVLPSRMLVVGGEPFGLDLLDRIAALDPPCAVFNHYGPTEATVGVAMYRADPDREAIAALRARGYRTVPIGTPLGDNRLVIDDDGSDGGTAAGEGELCIEGPQVADAYLASPSSPEVRFVGSYRTGDRARRRTDGLIEILGRTDRQFKLHGNRIEAVGVEEQIRAHPHVVDAIIGLRGRDRDEMVLVAWLQLSGALPDADLREFLAARLPPSATPGRFIRLDQLPRTQNGKVDFAALPDPTGDPAPAARALSNEDAVRAAFASVLALPCCDGDAHFFRSGGNSLGALRAIAILRKHYALEVGVEQFYADPTPSAISLIARSSAATASVAGADEESVSPQLLALWTHLQGAKDVGSVAVPFSFLVDAAVTAGDLRAALQAFAMRHPALRTRIETRDGQPFPMVDPDACRTLSVMNADDADTADLELTDGPVATARISRAGESEHRVDMVLHHAVWDGRSGAILVGELAALLAHVPLDRPAPSRSVLARTSRAPRPLGAGACAMLGMPPTPHGSHATARLRVRAIPAATWAAVDERAAALGVTPFSIVTAAWALVLSRQDGEEAVTIGTPADLRVPVDDAGLVGFHTDIVVLEVTVEPKDSADALIRQAHLAVGRAIEDRYRPYATLVAEQRAATATLPTRSLLTLDRMEVARAGEVQIRQVAVAAARPVLDLDLGIVMSERVAELHLHYRSEICPDYRAAALGDQFVQALELLTATPPARLSDLDIMPPEWIERVRDWSRGAPPAVPPRWSAADRPARASDDPDAIALMWPGGEMSREEFAIQVGAAANDLRCAGAGPGHAVAVIAGPSPALAVAWHAVQVVGAAVLGLDPAWPATRRDHAIGLAEAGISLTSPDGLELVRSGAATGEHHAPELAYLVMTSGSTGEPKLVAVQQSALANELSWFGTAFPLDASDCVLAHSSPGFDVCPWEMLGPLAWGAKLAFPAPDRRSDVPHLADLIEDRSITVIQAVPALLDGLTRELVGRRSSVRLMVSGGEELSPTLAAAIAERLPGVELVNTYGPSETAIDVVFHRVNAARLNGSGVPLGRPIAGVSAYVVDGALRQVPPGVFGQIAIGGAAVGLGYVGDAPATVRRFVTDHFDPSPGRSMYLTGDRARWDGDGVLEYGGRLDHQVKVRGNRVEIEAIEAELRLLPTVADAAVHLQLPGTMRARLAALLVPRQGCALDTSAVYEQCLRRLPGYMIPSVFGIVAKLPRLPNGKLSREAVARTAAECTDPVMPSWQDETEARVAAIWAATLERDDLVRHLPFFASGGTSLLVPVLQVRLARAFGEALSVPDLFEHNTIAAQAALLRDRPAAAGVPAANRGAQRRAAIAARGRGDRF